jgi:(p)ppGpp synthase/HD superfamily hydrolase
MNLNYYSNNGLPLTENELASIKYFIDAHNSANQKYDDYLPYEFHLHAVGRTAAEFMYLETAGLKECDRNAIARNIIIAAYGHDSLEDLALSFNQVKEATSYQVADIVFACTTEKGKNRTERFNDKFYQTLRSTPHASYVKLCDREANCWYGNLTGSSMLQMYKKEHSKFVSEIYLDRFAPLIKRIESYF